MQRKETDFLVLDIKWAHMWGQTQQFVHKQANRNAWSESFVLATNANTIALPRATHST